MMENINAPVTKAAGAESGLNGGLGDLIALSKIAKPNRERMLSNNPDNYMHFAEADFILVNDYVVECISLTERIIAILEATGSCTLKLDA